MSQLLISKGRLNKEQLHNQVVLVTGGGGGIGFEACRSLLWLGATVVIAEIDHKKGKVSELKLQQEFGEDKVHYYHTDIRSERSVKRLYHKVIQKLGKVDVIINNATIAYTGAAHKVGLCNWDNSYKVNLRGPVLLTSIFLPDMLKRNSGTIVFVPSSGAAPYLGAYEVFKTAQVELCNTLAAELESSGVHVFSIGPGLVKTETADAAIQKIAGLYGKTVEEFYKMSENVILSVEEAGAGFAAALTLAEQYNGLEVSSMQALIDCGISIGERQENQLFAFSPDALQKLMDIFKVIKTTLEEQVSGWSARPIFEKQWVLRDFKKTTGKTPEYFTENNKLFYEKLQSNTVSQVDLEKVSLSLLHSYYSHQLELVKGYEKDPIKLNESIAIIKSWMDAIDTFNNIMEESKITVSLT